MWWEGRGQGTGRGGSRGAGALACEHHSTPGHMREQPPLPPGQPLTVPPAIAHRLRQSHAVSHAVPLTETRAQHTVSHAALHRPCSWCSFSCAIYGHTQRARSTPAGRLSPAGHMGTRPRARAPALTVTLPPLPTVPVTLCQPHTHTHTHTYAPAHVTNTVCLPPGLCAPCKRGQAPLGPQYHSAQAWAQSTEAQRMTVD